MIQIEEVRIEEFRGIRSLRLSLGSQSFCVCGPNGSGKSGIVDAIEFALTGDITRLSGEGTAGLSITRHGPHVDRRDDPDSALVELKMKDLQSGAQVTITRSVKKPKEPKIEPDDDALKAVLEEMGRHPEIALSRREIIKFILARASDRSREVQSLLKLDDVDETRAALKTAANRLGREHTTAKDAVKRTTDDLRRHLDTPDLTQQALLEVVNKRRAVLGLSAIVALEKDTALNEGVGEVVEGAKAPLLKQSALRDLGAFKEALARGLATASATQVASAIESLDKLEREPHLLSALRKRSFVEAGLGFIEGPNCPLCDVEWAPEELRAHLEEKLQQSRLAEAMQTGLLNAAGAIRNSVETARSLIRTASSIAARAAAAEFARMLEEWEARLKALVDNLATVDGLVAAKGTLEGGWAKLPEGLDAGIAALHEALSALPDESAAVEAQKFLILAQERLERLRDARRAEARCERASKRASAAYAEYCDAAEGVLVGLYEGVKDDFEKYYRIVNQEDEGEFEAALSPSEGKLELEVDFYKRGKFPPGAYHSEGHQDAMGLCLYLALMKRVLGENFRLAVLDDVVMSVDRDHRKSLCRLLREEFPSTQFIITTHDMTWAKQMGKAGLVPSKAVVAFRGWKVDTGPIVEAVQDVWDEIEADLEKDKVSDAAACLRRHVEFVLQEIADELRAAVVFSSDNSWDLGELFPAVLSRYKRLLGRAAKSAQDWKNTAAAESAKARAESLSKKAEACGGEQWMINKSIHYSDWADLTSAEFRPVVDAFKGFLEELWCGNCRSWLRVTPRKGDAETLRCDCGGTNLNLVERT